MKTGLCSVTFRQLQAEQIVELVRQAGLDGIEWGGDLHVPAGDPSTAGRVLRLTRDSGLEVSSYGSYCFVLDEQEKKEDFASTLESALALETDTIRIWAGRKGSDVADESYRKRVAEHAMQIADQAQRQGVRVAFEFHRHTLTDTNESALKFLQECDHPNLYTYWQPVYWVSDEAYQLQGLTALRGRILNMHVFHCRYSKAADGKESIEWCPLEEGAQRWSRYLSDYSADETRYALLEFVNNNEPEQFLRDAATLKQFA